MVDADLRCGLPGRTSPVGRRTEFFLVDNDDLADPDGRPYASSTGKTIFCPKIQKLHDPVVASAGAPRQRRVTRGSAGLPAAANPCRATPGIQDTSAGTRGRAEPPTGAPGPGWLSARAKSAVSHPSGPTPSAMGSIIVHGSHRS